MKYLLIVLFLFIVYGCNTENKNINGYSYSPYGLLDEDEWKDPCVKYKASAGNVFWGIILIETIFAPIILWGYYLYEPVAVKAECISDKYPEKKLEAGQDSKDGDFWKILIIFLIGVFIIIKIFSRRENR